MSKLDLKEYLKNFRNLNISNEVLVTKYVPEHYIPQDFKFEKYEITLKNRGKYIKIKRHRLIGIFNNLKKIEDKMIYRTNKYGTNRRRLNYKINDGKIFVLLKSAWPSNNLHIKGDFFIKEGDLYLKLQDDYFVVWYEQRINQRVFVILPRFIELNDIFWETFGILFGEMTKSTIAISNTDSKVLNHIIKFFDDSNLIDKASWKFSFSLNCKEIYGDIKYTVEESKNFWSNKLSISMEKIGNACLYKQFKSTLNPNFGKIDLRFSNKALRYVINSLIIFVKDNVCNNPNYSIAFLRGLIAAEGCPGKRSGDYGLASIRIASKFEEERIFYAKICRYIGLDAKLYKRHNIEIRSIENFIKAFELKLFSLNEKRNRVFIERLNNLDTIKALKLLKNNSLTVREIVDKLKLRDYRNMNKNFNKLIQSGRLTRVLDVNGKYVYSLSKNLSFDIS